MADEPNNDLHERDTASDKVNKRLIYGRRQGHRLHKKQARLVDEMLPRLTPDLAADNVPADWFAKKCDDYVLEIGFGGGEHLAARALANPQSGFIGCEPFLNGVAKLVALVADEGRDNIAIYQNDARTILDALPDAALGAVYLLYPDPWPKKRHHKRRFVSAENLSAIHRVLRPGGVFFLASDIADYIDWSLIQIGAHGGFAWTADKADDWRVQPSDWPGTRYEAKALAAGRRPAYLHFTKTAQC
ncbi:MAG: tRNA (guanosine(46)-N7)-methyltransferase TrmB [Alphaproteobacteria bacterium]|nr:tRNA (guanosine(46)-N7)-methyltransferase TrmB [Alphaproteobacteria bacterium]